MDLPDLGHRRDAADGRQRALVAVVERPQRLPSEGALDVPRRMNAFLNRRRRDARNEVAVVLAHRREVADDEDLGMAGDRQVRLREHAPGAVELDAERLRQRRRLHARRPQDGPRGDGLVAEADLFVVELRDDRVREDFDAEAPQLRFGLRGEIGRIGREDALFPLDEDHARARRVDAAEVAEHGLPRDLGERAGELGAGRPRADDDEGEPGPLPVGIGLALSFLEGEEHAPPDLQRVLDGLEPRRVALPLWMREVGMRGAGGDDEVVVRDVGAVFEHDDALLRVDAHRLAAAAVVLTGFAPASVGAAGYQTVR